MGTRSFSIPFSSKRFRQALKARKMSVYRLGKIAEEKELTTKRSIDRNLQTERIRPNVLNGLCKIVNVDPDYVTERQLISMKEASVIDKKDSDIDCDGYLIPHYQSMDYSGFKDSQKALLRYLATRGFRKEVETANGTEYLPVSNEWFQDYFTELERVVHKTVQDFIDDKESEDL